MKTVEEWDDVNPVTAGRKSLEFIREIQLDAVKHGMTLAAKKCREYADMMRGDHVNANASSATIAALIIKAMDELKEV